MWTLNISIYRFIPIFIVSRSHIYKDNFLQESQMNSIYKKYDRARKAVHEAAPLSGIVLSDADLSRHINGLFSKIFNHNTGPYDTAIDAAYNSGGAGNSATHHITDGNHTLFGAFKAADNVTPDDNSIAAFTGAVEHLLRDFTTESGINPFFSITPETLQRVKDSLNNFTGISRSWMQDILTVNLFEAAGVLISLAGITYGFRKKDYVLLGRISGSGAFASIASANPVLALVAAFAAITAWRRADEENRKNMKMGFIKGIAVTCAGVAVSSLLGGGIPGILAGIYAAHTLHKKLEGKKCDNTAAKAFTKGAAAAAGIIMRRLKLWRVP